MSMTRIAVLVPFLKSRATATPASRPLGKLALKMRNEGVELVFCPLEAIRVTPFRTGRETHELARDDSSRVVVDGMVAVGDRWRPVRGRAVQGGYLRVASLRRLVTLPRVSELFRSHALPLVNTPALLRLCRDKLGFATLAEKAGLPTPPTEGDPGAMFDRLLEWGAAYFKPRHGARGRGVVRLQVEPGAILAQSDEGAHRIPLESFPDWVSTRVAREPHVLQQAVQGTRAGPGALSIRSLVQRDGEGRWVSRRAVVRFARSGITGNVACGAEVHLLEEVRAALGGREPDEVAEAIRSLDARVAAVIEHGLGDLAPLAVEIGVDHVLDSRGRPWVIEVNDTPQGRLGWLAGKEGRVSEREWLEVLESPIRYLVQRPPVLARGVSAWGSSRYGASV